MIRRTFMNPLIKKEHYIEQRKGEYHRDVFSQEVKSGGLGMYLWGAG